MNQLGVLYSQGLIPDQETAEQISFYTSGSGQHVPEAAEQLGASAAKAREEQRSPGGRVVSPRRRRQLHARVLEPRAA
jgi:hypothetical protein